MTTVSNWEENATKEMVRFIRRIEQEVENAKQESREPNVDPFKIRLAQWWKSSASRVRVPDVPMNQDIRASPLFELSSVRIYKDPEDLDDSFEIYGHVKLTNHCGKTFFLFNRGHDDPEDVFILDSKSAILPKTEHDCPFWLPQCCWLELYLLDKRRNVTIVHDEFLLDFSRKVVYDKEIVLMYNRGYGLVTVHYTVFRSAVLALVSFSVVGNEGSGSEDGESDKCFVGVRGTISATTKVRGRDGIPRVLYDRQSVISTTNDFTELSTLAVPAYALLRIKADLKVDGEQIVSGDDTLEFEPENGPAMLMKEIVGRKWRIRVRVCWLHASNDLDEIEFDESVSYDEEELSVSEEIVTLDELAMASYISEALAEREQTAEAFDLTRWGKSNTEESQEKSTGPLDFAREIVEVFSICVGSRGHVEGPSRLYGTIEFSDERKNYFIFERDRVEPIEVHLHEPLSLLMPQCLEAEDACFDIRLDLKDSGGREISKGYVTYNSCFSSRWHNQCLCSVVPGEQGFAYVHYAIFDDAVAANVCVRLLSYNDCDILKVYGSIHAEYSSFKYSNHYEKKYYRHKLFMKGKSGFVGSGGRGSRGDETILPSRGCVAIDIPLSRNMVAVPSYASLILKVDLHVFRDEKNDEPLRGKATFNPKESSMKLVERIKGQNCNSELELEVEVRWS